MTVGRKALPCITVMHAKLKHPTKFWSYPRVIYSEINVTELCSYWKAYSWASGFYLCATDSQKPGDQEKEACAEIVLQWKPHHLWEQRADAPKRYSSTPKESCARGRQRLPKQPHNLPHTLSHGSLLCAALFLSMVTVIAKYSALSTAASPPAAIWHLIVLFPSVSFMFPQIFTALLHKMNHFST